MPTYQYRCNNCNYEFETEQRITADPLTKCPECQKESLRRVIGSVGIAFKGSGFHINDYSQKQTEKKEKTTNTTEKKPANNNN